MGILFDDASSQYLQRDSAPVTDAPFAMLCWGNCDDQTDDCCLVSIGDKDSATEWWAATLRGGLANDPLRFYAIDGTTGYVDTTGPFTANTWEHYCAVEAASNSRLVYINGGAEGTSSTEKSPDGADRVAVGRTADSTPGDYMSGTIAEVAIYQLTGGAFTAQELGALAAGCSPRMVRSGELVAHWRLRTNTDLADTIGSYDLTAYNTPTTGTHPAIREPGAVKKKRLAA